MNFAKHFLDESLGSGHPDDGIRITEQGEYLCVQSSEHLVHVYQRVGTAEPVAASIAQMQHNGSTYKLAWIEDEQW